MMEEELPNLSSVINAAGEKNAGIGRRVIVVSEVLGA